MKSQRAPVRNNAQAASKGAHHGIARLAGDRHHLAHRQREGTARNSPSRRSLPGLSAIMETVSTSKSVLLGGGASKSLMQGKCCGVLLRGAANLLRGYGKESIPLGWDCSQRTLPTSCLNLIVPEFIGAQSPITWLLASEHWVWLIGFCKKQDKHCYQIPHPYLCSAVSLALFQQSLWT